VRDEGAVAGVGIERHGGYLVQRPASWCPGKGRQCAALD
jgi:hypothetical protein